MVFGGRGRTSMEFMAQLHFIGRLRSPKEFPSCSIYKRLFLHIKKYFHIHFCQRYHVHSLAASVRVRSRLPSQGSQSTLTHSLTRSLSISSCCSQLESSERPTSWFGREVGREGEGKVASVGGEEDLGFPLSGRGRRRRCWQYRSLLPRASPAAGLHAFLPSFPLSFLPPSVVGTLLSSSVRAALVVPHGVGKVSERA